MPKLPLTKFNIINLLGIESLPPDMRKEIVESAIELVETRTFNRVSEALGKEGNKELAKLLEAQDSEGVDKLFVKNNIDLIALSEAEVEKAKRELLEVSKK